MTIGRAIIKNMSIPSSYKLLKTKFIKDFNVSVYHLQHEKTGAQHFHVENQADSNNVFGVMFKTIPKNSSGVAHILEHQALCGSQKYDIRDPFFKMIPRSLSTFMNAMTAADFTVYPFSTQNKKDFYNLMSIYLDAAFFPLLKPLDFTQEAWRLEHEKVDDKNSPIIIRGVVFNEMKGALSSGSSIYSHRLRNHILPDTTYQYESGGDPEVIPSLKYDELVKFHKHHYHPTNAKFYTYGNLPLTENLQMIEDSVLRHFDKNDQILKDSIVEDQKFWTEPRTKVINCPNDPLAADPSKQTTTSATYLLPVNRSDLEELDSLHILCALLLDGPNTPFFKNLVESGIGTDYSPSTGLDNRCKQIYFSVGMQGINSESVLKVHEIIDETFNQVCKEGFNQERIDAVLHNIELSTKKFGNNFGLRLFNNLISTWNHDADIISSLCVNEAVDKFKQKLSEDEKYLVKLVKKYFIGNKHKLVFTMSPDEKFEEKRKEKDIALVEEKLKSANLEAIFQQGLDLKKYQETEQDPDILPRLEPSIDISKTLPQPTQLKFISLEKQEVQLCEQPTNGIVYFRALSNLSSKDYDEHLDDYLPLLCDVATKFGAGPLDRHAMSQAIDLRTGGLNLRIQLTPHMANLESFKKEVVISSICLGRNIEAMFRLWSHIFDKIHFENDKDYLTQMIKASISEMSNGINYDGHNYAMKLASSKVSKFGQLDERLSGLSYIARLKDISNQENIEDVINKLKYLASIVLDSKSMRYSLNAEPEHMDESVKNLEKFIIESSSKGKDITPIQTGLSKTTYKATHLEDMKFSFATHYIGKSIVTVPRLHRDHPILNVMSYLVKSKFLLKELREKAGAYGAGARMSNNGNFNFFTYRDPNTDKTLNTFLSAAKWIVDGSFTDRDVEESKLEVFQGVDAPVEPGNRGQGYFLLGETDEMRQEYRKKLLDVTREDIMAVAAKHLKNPNAGIFVL